MECLIHEFRDFEHCNGVQYCRNENFNWIFWISRLWLLIDKVTGKCFKGCLAEVNLLFY